jgi:hypothetical protein
MVRQWPDVAETSMGELLDMGCDLGSPAREVSKSTMEDRGEAEPVKSNETF